MRSLVTDFRWAVSSLRAATGTTVFAAATLAIGIGGTAAVFSLVNAVLLRALPYRDADRPRDRETVGIPIRQRPEHDRVEDGEERHDACDADPDRCQQMPGD